MMASRVSTLVFQASLAAFIVVVISTCSGSSPEPQVETGAEVASAFEEAPPPVERPTVLVIESWRVDDAQVWNDVIAPAFEAKHPRIDVRFVPTQPPEYDAALRARLDQQLAGDLIACRPFDASLDLYHAGHLVDLTGDRALVGFTPASLAAWSTDDGATSFCVPIASVIHGFLYNPQIFAELGLGVPETVDEFFAVLEAVERDGRYTPLAIGLADTWEIATVGLQTIGPTYWRGEQGRRSLIDGSGRFTDPEYVEAMSVVARWGDYLADGADHMELDDARRLFATGNAAIYPAGSWDLGWFDKEAPNLVYGAFPAPVLSPGEPCFVTDHTDMGMGLNPATENPVAARLFLDWVSGPEFAELYSNALPGFFSLRTEPVPIDHETARDFASWRGLCEATIRNSAQFLSRGEPDIEAELWRVSSEVAKGDIDPVAATEAIQAGLDSWFTPVTD